MIEVASHRHRQGRLMALVLDTAGNCRHTDRVSLAAAKRLEGTPQGYLWCRDVPLARTGTMEYGAHEVPIPALPGNRSVIVERTEDEVFAPAAIDSFRGMPLTDDHPDDDVTVENWRHHNVGDIHNPRRGEGEHADCLVADLLVKDRDIIAMIRSGRKRQLSCGYDAKYVDVRPGYGRQTEIRGNHVSLVSAGRAGHRIAIRDRLMSKPFARRRLTADTILAVFGSKDAAERLEQKRLLDEAMGEPEPDSEGGDADHKGDGHHVTVNLSMPGSPGGDDKTPTPPPPPPRDDAGDITPKPEGTPMDEDKIKEICGAVVSEAMAPMTEQLQALVTALGEMKTASDATAQTVAEVAEAVEDMTDPEDMATQDAAARAEVLNPGAKLPTMDSKPGSKTRKDALAGFQRTTLIEAFAKNPEARDVIRDAVGSPHPDFTRMSPSDVGILFRAASSAVSQSRVTDAQASVLTFAPTPTADGARPAPVTTAAAVQAANAKRWGR
jgi:hypothetical protein